MDTQSMTVRFPQDVYEKLRKEAFETRHPMNRIVVEALEHHLDGTTPEQYGDLCALFEAAWHHVVPDSLDDMELATSTEARKLALLATEAMNR